MSWRQQENSVIAVVERGLEYLRSHLFEHGWSSSALSGTYVLSLILRALACDINGDPELSEDGWALLRSRQCSDGGWTGTETNHGSGSVEHTAAVMTALAESGCCRYVSLLTSRGVIRQLTRSLDEVTRRKAALEEDIEGQVEERLGKAITERDRLRKQLKNREAEVLNLRELLDKTESSPERFPLTRPLERYLLPTIALVFVGAAIGILLTDFTISPRYLAPILAGIGFAIYTLGTFFRLFQRTPYSSETSGARHSRRLVEEFMDATEELPVSAREELVYRLAREGTDLPPALFLRFFNELTSKQLRIDRDTNRRLRAWAEKFAATEPKDRNALIVQLRRTIL
jgi:hypothetical protein